MVGNGHRRGMIVSPGLEMSPGNRTRLMRDFDHAAHLRVRGVRLLATQILGVCAAIAHWAAKTNGTLTVVVPLDAGNCQPRTRLWMQPASPR